MKIATATLAAALLWAGSAAADPLMLSVDTAAVTNGDCQSSPCWRITEAVRVARAVRAASATPIVIQVAPGNYVGNYGATGGNPRTEDLPIVLDISDVTLAGSTVLALDAGGLPTGQVTSETRLAADGRLMGNQVLLAAAPTTAASLSGVAVRGLSLDAGGGRAVVLAMDRVTDAAIEGNLVQGGTPGVILLMTSGVIRGNYATGNGFFGLSAGGGSAAHPATVLFSRNRSVGNGIAGIILAGSRFLLTIDYGKSKVVPVADGEIGDLLTATVDGNDLSENGVTGVREMAYIPKPSGDQHFGTIDATYTNNVIVDNANYGIDMDPGFSFRAKANPGPYSAAFRSRLSGNTIAGNGTAPALLSFRTIWWVLGGASTDCTFQPLVGSSITIDDPDGSLAGAEIENPTFDPNYTLGAVCPGDVTPSSAPLGNVVTVNGAVAP
jgi:hypothetical protein